ncbi:MAG: F0F1 ATP synthase subunit epsilon [Dehalococcoidia bacterium]|jgi:F-type H+-transporting ATPase subunit epsilon|nr:F0F1 ATP synthase subunit epsilon [Dehalococcoidia bacterium]
MPTHLQIITLDRVTYEDDVDLVVLPGIDGQLGVLPRHAPTVTALQAGEVVARKSGEEALIAVTGGFVQVSPESVVVLADAAEHAEEIDIERAQAARDRAQQRVEERPPMTDVDVARAESALARSLIRLKVAEKNGQRPGTGTPPAVGTG